MHDLIKQGIAAFHTDDHETAKKLFTEMVKRHPDDETAWGWLYSVCSSDQDRIICLKNMLLINPANEDAREILKNLDENEAPPVLANPPVQKINFYDIKKLNIPSSRQTAPKREMIKRPDYLPNRRLIFELTLMSILILSVALGVLLISGQLVESSASSDSRPYIKMETINGFPNDGLIQPDSIPTTMLQDIPIMVKNPRESSRGATAQLLVKITNKSNQPLDSISISLIGKSAQLNYFNGVNISAYEPEIKLSTAAEDSISFFKESIKPGENWELSLDTTAANGGNYKGKLVITFKQYNAIWSYTHMIVSTNH